MKLPEQCERCLHVRRSGYPCEKAHPLIFAVEGVCAGFESRAKRTLLTYAMLGAAHRENMTDSQQKETSVASEGRDSDDRR